MLITLEGFFNNYIFNNWDFNHQMKVFDGNFHDFSGISKMSNIATSSTILKYWFKSKT